MNKRTTFIRSNFNLLEQIEVDTADNNRTDIAVVISGWLLLFYECSLEISKEEIDLSLAGARTSY